MWKWKSLSPVWLCDPGQNTGVGSYSLLQGIFPTQGSNPGLPHCRRILYQLSHQGSPRILEWVAYHFSRGSSPTQGSNPGLLHCRRILYQLSYQGSPWKVSCLLLTNEFEAYGKINNQFWMADAWFCIFLLSQKIYFLGFMRSILNMSDSMAGVSKLFL